MLKMSILDDNYCLLEVINEKLGKTKLYKHKLSNSYNSISLFRLVDILL